MFEEIVGFFTASRLINICNFLAGYFGLCSGLAKSSKAAKLNRYMQLVFVALFMAPVYFLFHLGVVFAAIPGLNSALELHYNEYSGDSLVTLAISIVSVYILIRCRDSIKIKATELMTKENTYLALCFVAVVFLIFGTLVIPELAT
ncbi:hypothetical protein L1D19_05000 [Vibrio natriegens]|uniref:hypothetical protein n=1 Tax=Vibrio natriegens TaxID=691 RepID=UPI001EFECED8|nr:hypothetical protein [Vibrio natriegens]MCG9699488.1 hypothetical protein [Vibrio natriegens]